MSFRSSFFAAAGIVLLFGLYFWYMVAHSLYDVSIAKHRAFVTDECTLFFNGSWKECCIEHDRAYWVGGSVKMRNKADVEFEKCVYHTSKRKTLSQTMYWTVRVFGVPYVATPWRWGYGWDFGRGNR